MFVHTPFPFFPLSVWKYKRPHAVCSNFWHKASQNKGVEIDCCLTMLPYGHWIHSKPQLHLILLALSLQFAPWLVLEMPVLWRSRRYSHRATPIPQLIEEPFIQVWKWGLYDNRKMDLKPYLPYMLEIRIVFLLEHCSTVEYVGCFNEKRAKSSLQKPKKVCKHMHTRNHYPMNQ